MEKFFGGFASEQWKKCHSIDGFYGTGECFLFHLYPKPDVYPWTGVNNFCMFSTMDGLAMGGGRPKNKPLSHSERSGGCFGIWIDSEFFAGYSSPCGTFNNPQLAEKESFEAIFVEFWGMQSCGGDDGFDD